MKRFALSLAALALITMAFWAGQTRGIQFTQSIRDAAPITQQVITASGAAQSNAATLPAVANKFTYIEGFDLTGGGATGASVIEVSITGTTNTLKYEVAIAAGATAPAFGSASASAVYSVRFPTPVPASAVNTAITVTCPSFGAGNTNASVAAYGYTQ